MTDIVERLRADTESAEDEWELMDEAADEIERLRAALAELTAVCDQIVDAGHMNTEDLARLRAALEKP